MANLVIIYNICHPVTGIPFYVGRTENMELRARAHFGKNKSEVSKHIQKLLSEGHTPIFNITHRVDYFKAGEVEKSEIIRLRKLHGFMCNFDPSTKIKKIIINDLSNV